MFKKDFLNRLQQNRILKLEAKQYYCKQHSMVAYRVAPSHEQLSDKQTEIGLFGTS